jgi:glycosyltransferase involved in cell wall biosynthesis
MCGGMKYIADIVNAINERGGDARVALIKRNAEAPIDVLPELRSAPIVFDSPQHFMTQFPARVFQQGVVVAATSELVPYVKELTRIVPGIRPILHVQSYEPDMVKEEMKAQCEELFKVFPDVISNSSWITDKLKTLDVDPFATITPGVNHSLFYSRGREHGDDRPTVMVPLSKSYEYRGYNRGLLFIQELEEQAAERGLDIRILVYGVDTVPLRSGAICLGQIPQTNLAKLLGSEVDVFVDPSHLHSYGMPALEALASGATVVSWDNQGVNEYLQDSVTGCIFPDNTEPKEVAFLTLDLLDNGECTKGKQTSFLQNLIELNVLGKNNRKKSVEQFIEAVESQMLLSSSKKKIVFVTPHLRKHGGPSTILHYANQIAERGHDVEIVTIYTDINAEVVSATDLPINTDPHNIPKCDVLITNSDNPMNQVFVGLPQVKKKILLKLSHNERFKDLEDDSLSLPWDAIVTTSDWLKTQCESKQEGWRHEPVDATRLGWWHYGHEIMDKHPNKRTYNAGTLESPLTIGFLIHKHPLKGTKECVKALSGVYKKYGSKVRFMGIGEVDPKVLQLNLPNMRYIYSPNRGEMADILARCDMWVGASHTEGLGRMALEAMSAGTACILSDTGCEFVNNNHNALLFPIGDPQALAEKIDQLIKNPDLAKKIRESGYTTAMLAADPAKAGDALSQVIEEVCSK